MEGSLFLLRRSVAPTYQLFILNKKGTTNYAEDVRGGFQFEDAWVLGFVPGGSAEFPLAESFLFIAPL